MDAGVLAQVLRDLPPIDDPNVLVGTSTADDAGVYRLSSDLALVQTVDFFTPIVDDPETYGRIAAANALSDVYAMGARPVTALAIAAFPDSLDPQILGRILAGGAAKAREAGIAVMGGHTVKDDEPKYGLAVTGIAHPDRIVRNDTGEPGDALVLTKAIGTGVMTTARRADRIGEAEMEEAIASMEQLNRVAAEVMATYHAHAATDVTGFGLIGHLREMAGARLGAKIDARAVPLLKGALDLASEGVAPGGSRTNLANALAAGVEFSESVPDALRLLLCDAQTSGGLLVALPAAEAAPYVRDLEARGIQASVIGALDETSRICVN